MSPRTEMIFVFLFFIGYVNGNSDSELCAVYRDGTIYNFNCDGYCCEETLSGCCLYDTGVGLASIWLIIGIIFAVLLLISLIGICCYYLSRSSFCRWLVWSSSFSSTHIRPLIKRSKKSDKSGLSSSSEKDKTEDVIYEEIIGSDSFSSVTSTTTTTTGDSFIDKTPCCTPPDCSCPSLPSFDWLTKKKTRKSIPWDDEEAMIIPGSKGRRRMGRPVHWVGSSPTQSGNKVRVEKLRSLENVPVKPFLMKTKRRRPKHGKPRRRKSKSTARIEQVDYGYQSLKLKYKSLQFRGVETKKLSMSENNLFEFRREGGPIEIITGERTGPKNQQIPDEWAHVMMQLKAVDGGENKYRWLEEHYGRRARRRTTCLDSRQAERIVQTLDSRVKRRRKKRTSMPPKVSFERRRRSTKKYYSEGYASPTDNSDYSHLPPPPPYFLSDPGKSVPSSNLTSFADIMTQSSSDEDDQKLGRRKSSWYDIIKPRPRSRCASLEELSGMRSEASSIANFQTPREYLSNQVSPKQNRETEKPQQHASSMRESDTRALGLLDLGVWMTEQILNDGEKTEKVNQDVSTSRESNTDSAMNPNLVIVSNTEDEEQQS